KCLDLRQRGHVPPARANGHGPREQRTESTTVAHVLDTDARVDEDEAVRVRLDQQAMRNQPGTCEEAPFAVQRAAAARAHGAAVEMMDAHAQLAWRAGRWARSSTDFALRSQSSARLSAVSNLFFTGSLFDLLKYHPEIRLTSGDEAKNTDVRAP